jgi:hypothetical protein
MAERQEHQPGSHAPATEHYEELNVFGTPPGVSSMSGRVTGCRTDRVAPRCGGSRKRAARRV